MKASKINDIESPFIAVKIQILPLIDNGSAVQGSWAPGIFYLFFTQEGIVVFADYRRENRALSKFINLDEALISLKEKFHSLETEFWMGNQIFFQFPIFNQTVILTNDGLTSDPHPRTPKNDC